MAAEFNTFIIGSYAAIHNNGAVAVHYCNTYYDILLLLSINCDKRGTVTANSIRKLTGLHSNLLSDSYSVTQAQLTRL